ncbi:MAG: ferrous iron transport protein A [Chloroflexi bacterium]|nr:ferrous iron transport protein A [Chloroflexota bacterium]
MENIATCSLSQLQVGEKAVLVNLNGGRGIAGRLTALGFTPGVEITMVQNSGKGPLIVFLRGARVALGRNEARKIIVQRNGA